MPHRWLMLLHHHFLVGSVHEVFEFCRRNHCSNIFDIGMDKQGRFRNVWNNWRFRDVFPYSIESAIFA